MTFADLRNLVLYWVDDLQAGYFTSPQVNAFLNNAQKEVQKQLLNAGENYYEKTVETPLVIGQSDYILPTDLIDILRLEIVVSGTGVQEDKRMLTNVTLNQADMVITNRSGTPIAYAIKKDRFVIYPAPDQSLTMRLYYSYRVTDMVNDSDLPDVPAEFHEYIAVLAALDCFVKDDRVPTNIKEKQERYLLLMKQISEDRDESAPRMVRLSDDGGFGTLF